MEEGRAESRALCLKRGWLYAGPTGKVLLLPQDSNAVHIMVATGTGIAPYRAYLRRMFMEDVPNYKFTGLAWLFMGVANSDATLYDDEFQEILKKYPKQVRLSWGAALCSPSHMFSRSSHLRPSAYFGLTDVMLLYVLLTLLAQLKRWS